eukprot:s3401_g2.t1
MSVLQKSCTIQKRGFAVSLNFKLTKAKQVEHEQDSSPWGRWHPWQPSVRWRSFIREVSSIASSHGIAQGVGSSGEPDVEQSPGFDEGLQTDEFHEFEYSCWSLWSGFVVTLLVMILWRPQSRVFLDRICISTDDRLKAQSIFSLAGLLEKSDSMLILWDPTWTERLWCVFELAAFLQSKKDQPKELIIRPTFMGPVQVACFLTAVAGMIPMTMAPMDVASDTWFVVPSSLVFLSASALSYVTMSILRRYFRDLDVMKQQLWSFSFEQVKSSCCDNQHLTPSGARTMCDRRILKECVRMWFGSQKAFENTVCSEVMDILTRDLEQVFTTRSTLAMFVPLMWGFMDIGASEWHIWPGASIAFHIDGLSVWLVFMPMLKDVLVLVGKLTRTRPRSQCLEVLKNLLASFTLTLPALVVMGTYAFSWAIGVIHLADRWPRAWKPVRAGIFFGCMLLFHHSTGLTGCVDIRPKKSMNANRMGWPQEFAEADPMGAVTAFRSCEAAGAPARACQQGVYLMRRELLRWAKAPWRSPTAKERVRHLDEARGVALCADLWEMHRPGRVSDPGLSLALDRRLRQPARQALGRLDGGRAELSRASQALAAVAAVDSAPGREICEELIAGTEECRASDLWADRGRCGLHRGIGLSVGGPEKQVPKAPASPLVPIWLEGYLVGKDSWRQPQVTISGELEARGIPTTLRQAAEDFAKAPRTPEAPSE